MAPRVLVCIEDTGVAHVVAARLMRDGVDGVVVDKPGSLVDEARRGVAALAVQDRYPSGEAATSLLRQIRVARSEAVPAVLLVTSELPQGERLVLEKQYKVREFLAVAASPLKIADALKAAAGPDEELVLHDDEKKNEFDISIDSVASRIDAGFGSDEPELKTVEVSAADLKRMRLDQLKEAPPTSADDGEPPSEPPRTRPMPVTQEGGAAPPDTNAQIALTIEGMMPSSDLSQLPAPGGEMDLDFAPKPTARAPAPSPISAMAPAPEPLVSPAPRPPEGDEGDAVQIQELQKTQNELKKALLAERKKSEAAQKRVEELEAKAARGGDNKERTATTGVPPDGVFEDLRYPALLARCRADAFTGAIQMQSGGAIRTVYLRDGLPVAFHSSEPGERIGRVLVEQKRITEDQYQRATVRSVERSTKLTDALVELGYMDAETIAVELRNLTRDQIIAHFELVQGRFTTQAGATPDAQTATFDFGPGEIYVQGYRRYAPANEMMAAYETMRDRYLIANARLAGYRPKLGLTGDDERLIRLLGEALTVEEAVDRAQVAPDAASRLISALQALELVEEWSPGVEQFRSRIRFERQRHAEEIAQTLSDAKRREDRLIEAFEGSLKKMGVSISIAASLESEPKREAKPYPSTASQPPGPTVNAFASNPPGSLGTGSSGSGGSAFGAVGSATGAKPQLSVSTVTVGSTPPASSASSSPSPQVSSAGVTPSSVTAGSSSTGKESQATLSVADLKYKEGVDQAAQNRLDEAEVTLREAVRLDASKPEYLTSLARVLLANPRYERAGTLPVVRSLLDRAVQIAPDFKEAVDLHSQVIREMSGG